MAYIGNVLNVSKDKLKLCVRSKVYNDKVVLLYKVTGNVASNYLD